MMAAALAVARHLVPLRNGVSFAYAHSRLREALRRASLHHAFGLPAGA